MVVAFCVQKVIKDAILIFIRAALLHSLIADKPVLLFLQFSRQVVVSSALYGLSVIHYCNPGAVFAREDGFSILLFLIISIFLVR